MIDKGKAFLKKKDYFYVKEENTFRKICDDEMEQRMLRGNGLDRWRMIKNKKMDLQFCL